MVKKGKVGRRYASYSVTSVAIMAALLAVRPAEVRAEEAEEAVEAVNAQAVDQIDAEAARENGEEILEQETAIATQEEVVEEAQETVDQSQENVAELTDELDTIETEANAIEQEMNEVEEDVGSMDELEQAIIDGEEQAANLEADISETKNSQADAQAEVESLEEEVASAEQTIAVEEQILAELEEERLQLETGLGSDESILGENVIELPEGYLEGLSNYNQIENPTGADNTSLNDIALPGVELNGYVSQAEDREVVIEDASNLDNEIAVELAQFTAALLNPIRSGFGNEALIPNQNAIDMANAIANTYERDNHNPFENAGHHVEGIEEVAGEYGLAQGQFYENLGIVSWSFGSTLDDLKANIYDTIVRMLFDDEESAFGHALSLVGEMNDGVESFLGVSFSSVPAQTGQFAAHNTHFITVPNSSVYIQDPALFDTTANLPIVIEDQSEAIEALDLQIEAQRATVRAEEARLIERLDELSTVQNDLVSIDTELSHLNEELNTLNANLEEQRARFTELQDADALLNILQERYAEKEAERSAVFNALTAAHDELESAQIVLANEQARLAQLQEELEELRQAPYSFEEERTEEVGFETEVVYNPDLLVGTEEVSQAGVNGLQWLLENVVYFGDEVIDRIVVASELLVAPVSEILQVGTRAAAIEDIATPNESMEAEPGEPESAENESDLVETIPSENLVENDDAEVLEVSAVQELPKTGVASSTNPLIAGALTMLSGIGLMVFPKSRRKE